MCKPIVTHTTHPTQEQIKRVCPAPADHNVLETPHARMKRLMAQAAANRVRVKNNGDGRYSVPSQRKGADNRPVQTYLVMDLGDLGHACNCEWGLRHGPYQAEDNLIGLCSHIAQVVKYQQRAARTQARIAALVAQGQEEGQPSPVPTRAQYQANVAQAFSDLFGEAAA